MVFPNLIFSQPMTNVIVRWSTTTSMRYDSTVGVIHLDVARFAFDAGDALSGKYLRRTVQPIKVCEVPAPSDRVATISPEKTGKDDRAPTKARPARVQSQH